MPSRFISLLQPMGGKDHFRKGLHTLFSQQLHSFSLWSDNGNWWALFPCLKLFLQTQWLFCAVKSLDICQSRRRNQWHVVCQNIVGHCEPEDHIIRVFYSSNNFVMNYFMLLINKLVLVLWHVPPILEIYVPINMCKAQVWFLHHLHLIYGVSVSRTFQKDKVSLKYTMHQNLILHVYKNQTLTSVWRHLLADERKLLNKEIIE